jgi:hypothetical protein
MDKLELEVYDDSVIPSWTNWNWMTTVIKLRQSWTSRNSKEPDK